MKSDPRIVDARRRARTTARATGRSYQQTLDEVARSVGKADWNAFVVDPCRIPDDVVESAGDSQGSHLADSPSMTQAPEAPRHPLMRWPGAVLAVMIMATSMAWSYAYDDPPAGDVNAHLAWERTTAASSRMLSLFKDNDRTMYVMAQRLPGDLRDVRLILLDNRPADNGFATRVMLRTGMLDAGTRSYTHYMGGDGMFAAFDRHPVARLHHRVDCRSGIDTSVETEVADDMTSSPVAVKPAYLPFPTRLSAEDLETVCSPDTLKRTRQVETGT